MKRIWSFINNLVNANSQESSKRFVALYVVIILVSWMIFVYTDKHNVELILVELLGFAMMLFGVASWQDVRKNKDNQNKNQ